jgi:hypothetical protein
VAPQERGQPRGRQGLGDDLGRAGAQRLDGASAAGRECQGRDGRAAGPRLENDRRPLGGRKVEIDEAEIDLALAKPRDRLGRGGAGHRLATEGPHLPGELRAQRAIVVDDEDLLRHLQDSSVARKFLLSESAVVRSATPFTNSRHSRLSGEGARTSPVATRRARDDLRRTRLARSDQLRASARG